jgi:DNA primase
MNSKLTEQELNRIREIRIHRILGLYDDGTEESMLCPIHGGKRKKNFHLYPDNSFHCFKCNAHGYGAIDFCIALGYSFVDALSELVKYI